MKAEWVMFANYAEETGGLLLLTGATWDTINVTAPIQIVGMPEGLVLPDDAVLPVTMIQGVLVVRLLFHLTESNRDHAFSLQLITADGKELQRTEGQVHVGWNEDTPPEWDQGVNLIFNVTGQPIPEFGQYAYHLLVDGNHIGERPFRVMRKY